MGGVELFVCAVAEAAPPNNKAASASANSATRRTREFIEVIEFIAGTKNANTARHPGDTGCVMVTLYP